MKELRSNAISRKKPELVAEESSAESSSARSSMLLDLVDSQAIVGGVSLSPVGTAIDLDTLAKDHDKLIGLILAEEEELISTHRKSLDVFVQMLNEEMAQVSLIDQPGSDVDMYVAYMDENLRQKEEIVSTLRDRLNRFKSHLVEEEKMSRLFDAQHRLKGD